MSTENVNQWTRREFTLSSALAILSGVVITISSCSDDGGGTTSPTSSTPTPTPPAQGGDIRGVVGFNHGHVAVITAAQLASANMVSIDITGTSNHSHIVDLTAGEVGQIAQGTRVQTVSTNSEGHTHTVTFN